MKKILFLSALLVACGDASDPDTINPEELAPPLRLQTVTGDGSVELRWQGNNFEEDLVGYHVFISDADVDVTALKASYAPVSPTGIDIANNATVPYCTENATFFTAFGITQEPSTACDDASSTGATLSLAEGVGVVDAKVDCYDPDEATTSLAGTEPGVSLKKSTGDYADGIGIQRCLIKTDRAGTALQNGKSYSFFVVAVVGDEADGISWTSNVVSDTPAPAVVDNTTYTLPAAKYKSFSFNTSSLGAAPTVSADTSCGTASQTAAICGVFGTNTSTTAGLYLARDNSATGYDQRIFLSVPQNGSIELLYKTANMTDSVKTGATARLPGDMASSETTLYAADGKGVRVASRQIYDFRINVSSTYYYGKIAIGDISYKTATDKASDASIPVTIVVQSKANSYDYLR